LRNTTANKNTKKNEQSDLHNLGYKSKKKGILYNYIFMNLQFSM